MKWKDTLFYGTSVMIMIALIADSKQTVLAASQGLELCLRTAIPSLFPFFVLSAIIVPGISSFKIPLLGKLLQVPAGWESVFLLSCAGGYPIGAQCICQGFKSGTLSREQAQRMLGFCNNCGPSFLFGVVAQFFPHPVYALLIMLSGILSAIIVGALWPGFQSNCSSVPKMMPVTLPKAVKQAIQSMANVCAWIMIGKISVHFLDLFLLHLLPDEWSVLATGILELTNGCVSLGKITNLPQRLSTAAFLCSFGGVCVYMQINSICNDAGLSCKFYLFQKITHGILSCIITAAFFSLPVIIIFIMILCIAFLFKTTVAFPRNIMYNKFIKGGVCHAVSKKD